MSLFSFVVSLTCQLLPENHENANFESVRFLMQIVIRCFNLIYYRL